MSGMWIVVAAAALVVVIGLGLAAHTTPGSRLVHAHPGRQWTRLPRRRAGRVDVLEQLAVYLDALASEVRVGGGLGIAFETVTPRHPRAAFLGEACRRVSSGAPLAEALAASASQTPPGADETVVMQALACAATVGGQVAATLDAAAVLLRERAALAADARSHSAQARLSARVLTLVPLAFAVWGVVGSSSTRHAYLSSGVGLGCVLAGIALNSFGWLWMRRIIGAAEGCHR